MAALRDLSPLVEPISLDEAFVDLAGGTAPDLSPAGVRTIAETLRADIRQGTRITASVGAATSKLLAKIASEQAKPDGLVVVDPGTNSTFCIPSPCEPCGVWAGHGRAADPLGSAPSVTSAASRRPSWWTCWGRRTAARCTAWHVPRTTGRSPPSASRSR